MQENEGRTITEGAFIAFMLAFWPILLILGIVDHFFLPEHDLRLPTLVLAGAAGWLAARVHQRRVEEAAVLEESR